MEAIEDLDTNLFRPAKKRKFMRRARGDEDPDGDVPLPNGSADTTSEQAITSNQPTIADIIRQRKANRTRKHGVESKNAKQAADKGAGSTALATADSGAQRPRGISDRFIGHSGQVVDVDKHMVAYIESEMAKRRLGERLPRSSSGPQQDEQSGSDEYDDVESAPDTRFPQRQPASVGKIHEIDLGKDASLRNVERTDRAIRRQKGEVIPVDEPRKRQRKPRIGRDGKPMRPRPRKQRNSEDVKRDQLVEQVLKESKLDIYDESEVQKNLDDLEADDRVAEQFRQDFIDAMQSRQRTRTAGQPKPPPGKAGETGQKGPKLGGSRSARAAMREQQEKSVKK